MPIGKQIIETLHTHERVSAKEGKGAGAAMLGSGADPAIRSVFSISYPHEVSGGMGQRVMIAMMLVCGRNC